MANTVQVNLRRTYGYLGTSYGPGVVSVPQGLARALGLEPIEDQDNSRGDGADLPPVSKLEDHLASLTSVDEVRALQNRDERKTALPLYEARIAELNAE